MTPREISFLVLQREDGRFLQAFEDPYGPAIWVEDPREAKRFFPFDPAQLDAPKLPAYYAGAAGRATSVLDGCVMRSVTVTETVSRLL